MLKLAGEPAILLKMISSEVRLSAFGQSALVSTTPGEILRSAEVSEATEESVLGPGFIEPGVAAT